MEINNKKDEIQFLYLLRHGAAGRSYGIHVAELAGLPPEIINQAKSLLKNYELKDELREGLMPIRKVENLSAQQMNLKLFDT